MTKLDFKQLGLQPGEHEGKKRMHSVVIDEKVIPLLKETKDSGDPPDVLTGVSGLNCKIV